MELKSIKEKLLTASINLSRLRTAGIDSVDEERTLHQASMDSIADLLARNQDMLSRFDQLIYTSGEDQWMSIEYMQLLAWFKSWTNVCTAVAENRLPLVYDVARHVINVSRAPEYELEEGEEDLNPDIFFITLRIDGFEEVGCYVDWVTGQVAGWRMLQESGEEPLAIYTIQHLIFSEEYADVEICIYRGLPNAERDISSGGNFAFPEMLDGIKYTDESLYDSWEHDLAYKTNIDGERSPFTDSEYAFRFLTPLYFVRNLQGKRELQTHDKSIVIHHLLMSLDNEEDYALLNLDDRYFIVSKILGVEVREIPEAWMLETFAKVEARWLEPRKTINYPFTESETCYFEIMRLKTGLYLQMKENMQKELGLIPRQTGKQHIYTHCMNMLNSLIRPSFEEEAHADI